MYRAYPIQPRHQNIQGLEIPVDHICRVQVPHGAGSARSSRQGVCWPRDGFPCLAYSAWNDWNAGSGKDSPITLQGIGPGGPKLPSSQPRLLGVQKESSKQRHPERPELEGEAQQGPQYVVDEELDVVLT